MYVCIYGLMRVPVVSSPAKELIVPIESILGLSAGTDPDNAGVLYARVTEVEHLDIHLWPVNLPTVDCDGKMVSCECVHLPEREYERILEGLGVCDGL